MSNTNQSGTAGGIDIVVPAGRPPLTVNSAVRVPKLNSDKVDGIDAD